MGCMRQQQLTLRCQRDAAMATLEQFGGEFVFEGRKLATERSRTLN